MIRQTWRLAAETCAEIVWRMPALEPAFVGIGTRTWRTPGIGRFYRSAAWRLSERLRLSRPPFRAVTVAAHPLVLDVTEFTAGPLYFGGSPYEPATTAAFTRCLRPGQLFIDIGANHGYFSLLAAALIGPAGRVIAFEPNPRVFEQLQAHVTLNHFEARIRLESCALADTAQVSAALYVSQVASNSGLSSLTPNADTLARGGLSASATVPVTVETFDRWLAASGILATRVVIDLVKIDVEGAEERVITGMRETLRRGIIRALIVETPWESATHRAIVAAGYDATALDQGDGGLTNVLFSRRRHDHA